MCDETFDGDVEELKESYVYPENPTIDDEWPSEKQLQQELPRLYNGFWDDENSRTLK